VKVIKLELIKPFVQATKEVLSGMLNLDVKAGEITLKEKPYPMYEVSAMMSIHGDINGIVSLSMSQEAAQKVVTGLLGDGISDGERLTADAVGELLNIIVGAGKGKIKDAETSCGIPSVVIGTGHTIWQPRDIPSAMVPLGTEWGDMALEVNFKVGE